MHQNQRISVSKLLVFAVTILFFAASGCDHDPIYGDNYGRRYTASEDFSFDLSATEYLSLKVVGLNGDIEIIGDPQLTGQCLLSGEKQVESDSRGDALRELDHLQVKIVREASQLVIQTDQPESSRGREYIVNYVVRIPVNWTTEVELLNGNISISDMTNAVRAAHSNGNITISNIEHDVAADLVNGNITLENVNGNVETALVNGNISAEVILTDEEICILHAVNGTISLRIPGGTSAELNAGTTNGTIRLANLLLENANFGEHSVTGILNGGAGKIHLQTVNGSIVITGF